jgi:aminopeptidase N
MRFFLILIIKRVLIFLVPAVLSAQDGTIEKLPPEMPPVNPDNQRPFDVTHYEIDLALHPSQHEIIGSTRIEFQGESGISDKIDLDFSGLVVDSVRHEEIRSSYTQTDQILTVEFQTQVLAGDSSNVTVYYHGIPKRGIYFRQNLAGDTVVYSHNEPYDARFWFPCNDDPSDKATATTVTAVPADYLVLGNGRLRDSTNGSSGGKYRWEETYPIATYLISLAAAPYQVVEKLSGAGEGSVLLQYFVYEGDQNRAMQALEKTTEILGFYESFIAPYPFGNEKYAMGAVPFREAAAMENQTATTMRDDIIDNESVIAHELAHQWWGDAVSPESFAHIWLNEGFATYFDALFTEYAYGEKAFEDRMSAYSSNIYGDGSLEYPVFDPPEQYLFGRAVYYKGAWILHMLREMVGDLTFRDICRQYYRDYQYRNVTTRDFISICNEKGGRSFDIYFNQWLNFGGIPFLEGSCQQENGRVTIDLEQLQNEVIYNLELDLQIEGSNRDTTFQISMTSQAVSCVIGFSETVIRILIDPANKVLEQNNGPLYNIPRVTALNRLYPNPFNRSVTIEYAVAFPDEITIEIMNILGQTVTLLKKKKENAGIHTVIWDGSGSASGVYICMLSSSAGQDSRKIILLK